MIFIDTNHFLRFLLKDLDKQHRKAKQIFKEGAEGKVKLITSLIVFFEIYWVLSSFYKKQKPVLVEVLEKILKMQFIKLDQRDILEEAVKVFAETNFDLEDAYNLVYAKKAGAFEFASFDKKLLSYSSHFLNTLK